MTILISSLYINPSIMKLNVITLTLFSCLLSVVSQAHVITGNSTEIDASDGNAKALYIKNYTGSEVISIPSDYNQVYVQGYAELEPFSNTGRSIYVESDSSFVINGDVNAKIVQAQVGVTKSSIQITGDVTVNSMFAIAEPSNTVQIGGTLKINGLNSFVESGSNVYANSVVVAKALTGVKVAGSIYTNSFVTKAATTTFQAGSLLSALDSQSAEGLLINKGSTVICAGEIEVATVVEGGTLTLNDAAVVADVTLDSGTLKVLGDAQIGALTLNSGSLIFNADTTLDLNGAALTWTDGVSITLNVDNINQLGKNIVLFDNISADSVLPESLTITVADKTGSTQTTVTLQDDAIVINVPEPASSALAVWGFSLLAMRRRRKH